MAERLARNDRRQHLVLGHCGHQGHPDQDDLSYSVRAACVSAHEGGLEVSMEVFLALVASANHEHQFGRADVEAQDVAGFAERDDEFAQRRPGTDLAVAVRRFRQVAQCNLSDDADGFVGHFKVFERFGAIEQKVVEPYQVVLSALREFDGVAHPPSCLRRLASLDSSLATTWAAGMDTPVRSYSAKDASHRDAKSV